MVNLFNYIDRESPIHRLTGATKLLCLLLWCLAAMTSFYTPLLIAQSLAGIVLFRISKIKFREVRFMLTLAFVFLLLNNLMIYLFSPEHGTTIYGTRTVVLTIAGPYTITLEQLFYQLNVMLKYSATIPIVLLFINTTNPSEFAASLNRIGVSYRIAYSVALALRYVPDIQREYHDISQAQQARGTEMSKKASLVKRLKAVSTILIPLVLSSVARIETIANAMELRGFGKNEKRTWYMSRKFRKMDIASIAASVAVMLVSLSLTILNGSRYYNPFV